MVDPEDMNTFTCDDCNEACDPPPVLAGDDTRLCAPCAEKRLQRFQRSIGSPEEAERVAGILHDDDGVEVIAKAVHDAWWAEKQRQGKADTHPDAIPYEQLSESVKEYDRVTARVVLSEIRDAARAARGGDSHA